MSSVEGSITRAELCSAWTGWRPVPRTGCGGWLEYPPGSSVSIGTIDVPRGTSALWPPPRLAKPGYFCGKVQPASLQLVYFQYSEPIRGLHQNTSLQSLIDSAYSANISGFSLQLNGTHHCGSQPEGRRRQDHDRHQSGRILRGRRS